MTDDPLLDAELQSIGGSTVLRPLSELDATTAEAFRDHLAGLVGTARVVVDLDEVPFMDSAGLAVLIGAVRRIRDAGGDAAVACDRQPLRRLLTTAGLDRIVTLASSASDAAATLLGAGEG